MLEVDIALLRALSTDLTVVADTVGKLDGASGLMGVRAWLTSSDTAGLAAGAGERVEAAVKVISGRVRAMATAASSGASTYAAAAAAFAAQLRTIGAR